MFAFTDEFLSLFVGFINNGFDTDKLFGELVLCDFEVDLFKILFLGVGFCFELAGEVLVDLLTERIFFPLFLFLFK